METFTALVYYVAIAAISIPEQSSFFVFFLFCPSLVFMTHNLLWKPQFSLPLIPLFPLTLFSVPKEQLCLSESSAYVHLDAGYVCMSMQGSTRSGEFQKDKQQRVTMVMGNIRQCDLRVVRQCVLSMLSLAGEDFSVVLISPWIHSALNGYFRFTLFDKSQLVVCLLTGIQGQARTCITCMAIPCRQCHE